MRVAARWGLVAVAAAVVVWVRLLPLSLDGVAHPELLRYRGEDGREHVYLGDFDSYLWLRQARNYLRTGTTCDAVVGGECRDTYALAPVGMGMRYARSLHIAAIVGLHRLIRIFQPEYPLPASAFWVPVLVGAIGAVPAFLLGERLAGPLGGFAAALLVGTNAFFLQRSIGADNDVWNVVLPLFVVAAAAASTAAERPGRQAAYAVLAAGFEGLHAATWSGWTFTYVVVTIGLSATALVRILRVRLVGAKHRDARRRALVRGLLPLVVFYLAGALFAAIAGSTEGLAVPLRTVTTMLLNGFAAVPQAGDAPPTAWPSALSTVAELERPDPQVITGFLGHPVYFFAGCVALFVLFLPRKRWRLWHLGMAAGILLYAYLLTGLQLDYSVVVGLLALPVPIGMILATTAGRAPAETGGALLLGIWFVAALYLCYGGVRFTLLLVAPAGIACGVAVGRLHLWLSWAATRIAGGRRSLWAVVLFVIVGGSILPAVGRGVAAARGYVPQMDDAFWDTLTHIRDESPPDAIVNTWWDFGHWTKYVAERRVSADGASLRTHVPYWLARALLAKNERETVGLLRMLDCGSDATPEPEGRLGAYGKLVARGLDSASAHAVVLTLASLDRPAAGALLAERGLAPADVKDVLASTHCSPPPAYLMLSTDLVRLRGIRYLADWHFERPRVNTPALRLWASPRLAWRSCTPAPDDAAEWACRPAERASPGEPGVFRYRPDAPDRSRFLAASGRAVAPAAIVLAEAGGVRELSPIAGMDRRLPILVEIAVLVDIPGRRALVGPPDLIRSTIVDLLYLDGRYAKHFEKFDDRVGYRGERVVTWQIRNEP